ncbi:MAG TPA: type III pantothenate kinase [Chitinivibrionales bacterium]|nr:type III pantothenate kinase [Chitinivibrionales bacterium]
MKQNLVLALDIGNTNTHFGLVDTSVLSCKGFSQFPTADIENSLVVSLRKLMDSSSLSQVPPLVISSVAKINREDISRDLHSAGFPSTLWLEPGAGFPFSIVYQNISSLGADRLANCLYAHEARSGQSSIIISAGTAITVDFLKNGKEFCGGTILPGIFTQLKSLHDHTGGLPLIELDEGATEFPGTSTRASMVTGVTYGTAGALSFLVERYRQQFGSGAKVLATGGSWNLVEKLVTFDFRYVKEMTLVGTGLFWTHHSQA